MSRFLEYKKKILNLFNDCTSFAEKYDYVDNAGTMNDLKRKVEEDKIVVLTCGEMKGGKSSLIKALLEDEGIFHLNDLFPNCVVTMVSYSPEERVTAVLEDTAGRETSLSITRAELTNHELKLKHEIDQRRAKLLLIETPNIKLKEGLVFVDTPGIGSMDARHIQITCGFLNKADMVLFISDATSPITDSYLGFLKQVKNRCSNILFPMTKKDTKANFGEIMETNRDKISRYTGIPREELSIIPVSSTEKLAYLKGGHENMLESSNYEALEKMMWDIIYKKCTNIVFSPPMEQLSEELIKIERDLYINETALGGSLEEVGKLKEKLLLSSNRKAELLTNASDWCMGIYKEVEGLIYTTDRLMGDFYDEAMEYLYNQLQDLKNLARPYLLLNEVVSMLSQASYEINSLINSKIADIMENFRRESGVGFYNREERDLFSVTDLLGGPLGRAAEVKFGEIPGGAAGEIHGGLKIIEQPDGHHRDRIRNDIKRIIENRSSSLRREIPGYLEKIRKNLITTLRRRIYEEKAALDSDIDHIWKVAEYIGGRQREEKLKYQRIREEYALLRRRFTEIMKEIENPGL